MSDEEALKHLHDCASAWTKPVGKYMANILAYQIIEDRITTINAIEKELGISMVTLFKAMKEGFYMKNRGGDVVEEKTTAVVSMFKFPRDGKQYFILESNKLLYGFMRVRTEDYGKTWALTKEELL